MRRCNGSNTLARTKRDAEYEEREKGATEKRGERKLKKRERGKGSEVPERQGE